MIKTFCELAGFVVGLVLITMLIGTICGIDIDIAGFMRDCWDAFKGFFSAF